MFKLLDFKYNKKLNWTGLEPISINNLFLDLDWNNFKVIEVISARINLLSSLKESLNLGGNNISAGIKNMFENTFPNYLSSINNISNFYSSKVSGISQIYLNDYCLTNKKNYFLTSLSKDVVNKFNNLTGDLFCISSVVISNTTIPYSKFNSDTVKKYQIDLGNFIDYDTKKIIISVNGTGGDNGNVNVITSVKINSKEYNTFDNTTNCYLNVDISKQYFRKNEVLPSATVLSGTDPNSIVNILMYNQYYQTSTQIKANTESIISNVVDWICIVGDTYTPIEPISASLIDNTLKITASKNGTLYFIKKSL